MKRLVRFMVIAILGLILSLNLTWVQAQTVQEAYQRGDFAEAQRLLNADLEAHKLQPNPLKQAQTLAWLALTQQKLGDFSGAETSLAQSLALIQPLAATVEKNRVHAQILNTQGTIELAQGQAQNALITWQRSEQLYQKAGDRLGVSGSQINQAQAWEVLGFYRRSCNTVLKALEINPPECEQLTPASLAIIAKQPPQIALIGFRSLGNLDRLLGKLDESVKVLEMSLALAQEINSPQEVSKTFFSLGNTQQALAIRAETLNQPKNAEKLRQSAADYYQKAAQLAGEELLLLVHLQQFHLEPSQDLIPLIQAEIASLPPSRTVIYAQVDFAETLANLKAKNPQTPITQAQISRYLEKARQEAVKSQDQQAQSYALGTLGKLSNSQGLLEQALIIAQAENSPEIAYRWQWQLGRIYRQQGKIAEAMAAYRAAFDTLQVLRGDLVALNLDIQFSFREQVEPVYREYAELLLESGTQEHLKKARQVIEALQIAELDNYFQDVCSTIKKDNVEGIDPKSAIFYTIVLQGRLAVILSLPDGSLVSHITTISQKELESQAETLRRYLQEPDRLLSLKPISQRFYQWLIEPFNPQLQGNTSINTLVFVLDGVLQNLPMGVLYDGEKYLAQKYAIALTPSLQLLGPKFPQRDINALITGVSQEQTVDGRQFSSLENVPKEWKSLQSLLPSSTLFNTDFTKSNLQKSLTDDSYSIVHIATHGQFSSDPEQTYLLLWNQLLNVKDWDSLFQLRNRQQSGLIDLLVLSACETASGDKRAALGLAGVAVRTGARSTLATLWQVNDEATAVFMEHFYEILRNNPQLSKSEVLQKAQLKLMETVDQDWAVPYFWASYVLVGNWL